MGNATGADKILSKVNNPDSSSTSYFILDPSVIYITVFIVVGSLA
jgi:hypothetical protein